MKQPFYSLSIFLLFLMSIGPLSISAKNEVPCLVCDLGNPPISVDYNFGDGTTAFFAVDIGAINADYQYIFKTSNLPPIPMEWTDNSTLANTSVTGTTFGAGSLPGLTFNTTYHFFIRRRCGMVGAYEYSAVISTSYTHQPACGTLAGAYPTLSLSSTSYTSATINFPDPPPAGLSDYEFQLSTASNFSTIVTTVTVAASSMPYTFTGLATNTTYYVRYRPSCTCNATCAYQNAVWGSFTTLSCAPPMIQTIYFQDETQAILVFTPPVNTTNVSGYEYAVTASAAAPAPAAWIASATSGTKTLTGLVVNTAYYVHVRTICGSFYDTRVVQAYTHNVPCTTPTSFGAIATGYSTGTLRFTAPSWINQIEYQVSTSSTFDVGTIAATATVSAMASPLGLTGLAQGTLYYARARSVCPSVCATSCGWTATADFFTQTCYETLLLTQRANSTSRLVFHWLGILGALGQEYTLTNTATSAVITSGTLAASATDLTLAGLSLSAGTEYAFNLRTQCTASDFSAYKSVVFTACNAPTTLPYSVNFNNYMTDALPCSWETQGDATNEGWRQLQSSMGGPLVGILTWAQDLSDGDWAYSPNLSFSAGNYELLLDFSTVSFANTSKFQIYLTDSYDPSVFTVSGTKIFTHIGSSTERTNLGIPFTVGAMGAKHLVFHGETGLGVINLHKLTVRQTPVAADLAVAEYGNDDVCNTFYAYNVNSNGWYNIYNTNGNVVASVNPGSVNLGTVTLQMKDASAVLVGSAAGVPRRILPRHFGFGSNQFAAGVAFGSTVQVKIYFSEAEMAALRTAAGLPGLMPSQISLTHFSPPTVDCDIVNNLGAGAAPELIVATSYEAIAGGNHCLQFGVAHFSEITPHEPSASPLSGAVLPIELLAFKAKLQNETVEIQWQTAIEQNVHDFTIERSTDGKNFIPLSIQTPKGSNSTYTASDKTPIWGVNGAYYRLKINDLDGTFSYSKVVNVSILPKGFSAKVYPNPFDKNLMIDILTDKTTDVQIALIDILGRQVFVQNVQNTEGGIVPLSIPNVPSGAYILKISAGNQRTIVQRLIKN